MCAVPIHHVHCGVQPGVVQGELASHDDLPQRVDDANVHGGLHVDAAVSHNLGRDDKCEINHIEPATRNGSEQPFSK